MNQRPSKIRSIEAVNMWSLAEMGSGRGKKLYKKAIKRKRRVLEKREFEKELKSYYKEE